MKPSHRLPRIYFFGGSFNPPGMHHVKIVSRLQERLGANDLLWIMPCGDRPDKPSTSAINRGHRIRMTQLAFGDLKSRQVLIDYSDLRNNQFTPAIDLEKKTEESVPEL